MYVPTSFADEFAAAAEIMIDHKVFLECDFPKIVDIIRQKTRPVQQKSQVPIFVHFLILQEMPIP
jgi:hypothetical protein